MTEPKRQTHDWKCLEVARHTKGMKKWRFRI